jgi:ATP-dependent DNA helicase RecG
MFREKESSTLEFKQELPKNNQIVKTIIGFANQFGGRLIIGVAENGSIVCKT